jgi:tetratricopeptide (TPR) repeat protein
MYKKEHFLFAALAAILVLVIYTLTMAPTVTFWDAGEFIAASYCLGVPHPPGTPLFVLMGRVLATLPLPLEIAERLNFVSVLSGSLGAFLLFLIAVKILETMVGDCQKPGARLVVNGGAFICAVIPPFLFTVWSNSTEFEVYSVATATIVFCGWLMVYMGSLKDSRKIKNILLLAIYIVSLSIANHLIVLLVTPAVIIYTLLHDRKNWKYWCSILGCFLGLYLMVMKGLDLTAIADRLSGKNFGDSGLFVAGFRIMAAMLDIFFNIVKYVGSWSKFLFGLAVAASSLYWARKHKALGFFGVALGLFLLGFSVHLYLLIRSGLNPALNEGQPETLKAFWAVIGRDQYGSAYGLLPRQAWQMIVSEKMKLAGNPVYNPQSIEISSIKDLVENIIVFFRYNIPFYTKYFGWQFGNQGWTLLFLALGIFGAAEHAKHEKKSFYFWLVVFLITGLILNTYMNFKLGFSQAGDIYQDRGLHEVRERDYFFIVSFAFFGLWSGLGLAAVLNRLRLAFAVDTAKPKLALPAFRILAAVVLLPGLIPLLANYQKVDRSGNFIPPDYARNMMNSLEPNAILFTNGDNDTFPLWYIQEVEGVRKDCRIVNLSLLNTKWYIKQLRDTEPKLPISLNDEKIDKLRAYMLSRNYKWEFGEMELAFKDSSVIDSKDQVILNLLRINNWRQPIYFTTSTPSHNRCRLDSYLVQHGAVYKVYPRRNDIMAKEDSLNIVKILNTDLYLDVKDTRRLLDEVYKFRPFTCTVEEMDKEEQIALGPFDFSARILGRIYLDQGKIADAAECFSRTRQITGNRHQLDLLMVDLFTNLRQYEKAYAFLDSMVRDAGDRSPHRFMQMSQKALDKGDTDASLRFMELCTEHFPDYRDAYANIFLVHETAGDTQAAVGAIENYISKFPDDTVVAGELKRYRETGRIDLQKAFNIPAPQ